MDDLRFDRLVQSLVQIGSRRRLLAGLAAGALGLAGLGGADVAAAVCRGVGRTCSKNAHCCSGSCAKGADRRRRCACQSPADCPAPADACVAATCAAGACGLADVDTLGAPCRTPLYWDGGKNVDPIGSPGIGCCGDQVCHNIGTCSVNRPPGALDLDFRFPWKRDCNDLILVGYDPDGDAIGFEIVTHPEHGFLTEFVFGGATFAEAAPDAIAAAPAAAGVRALIAGEDCVPRNGRESVDITRPLVCPNCVCPDCSHGGVGGDTDKYCPIEWCSMGGPTGYTCPEGDYFNQFYCYVTRSTTFTGIDSFTYRTIDPFGGRSEPALVTITIFEV